MYLPLILNEMAIFSQHLSYIIIVSSVFKNIKFCTTINNVYLRKHNETIAFIFIKQVKPLKCAREHLCFEKCFF